MAHKAEVEDINYQSALNVTNNQLFFHLGALIAYTEPYDFASIIQGFTKTRQAQLFKGAFYSGLQVPLKIFSLAIKNNEQTDLFQTAFTPNEIHKNENRVFSEKEELQRSIALLLESFEYEAYNTLFELLKSEDKEIVAESILAAGRLQRLPLLPFLLQATFSSSVANFSLHALREYGNAGITPLLQHLLTYQGNEYLINHIHIALSSKQDFTREQSELLVKLFFQSSYYEKEILITPISQGNIFITKSTRDSFHEVFEMECKNLFFLMSVEKEVAEFANIHPTLAFALKIDIRSRMHFILSLLGAIYDNKTVSVLANIIESNALTSKMYVVEMMNFIFSKNDIEFFMPLVDNYCFGQKFSLHSEPYFYTEKTVNEAIKALLYARGKTISDYTRVEALAAFDEDNDAYKEVLLNCYIHPENAVAEWATHQLFHQYPELLQQKETLQSKEVQARLEQYLQQNKNKESILQLDAFRKIAEAFQHQDLPVLTVNELIETSVRAIFAAGVSYSVPSKRAYGFIFNGHFTCNGNLDIASNGFFMSTCTEAVPSIIINFTASTKLIIFNTSVFDAMVSSRPKMIDTIISFYTNIQTP